MNGFQQGGQSCHRLNLGPELSQVLDAHPTVLNDRTVHCVEGFSVTTTELNQLSDRGIQPLSKQYM
ncbi:hypothetical protein D3C80_2163270 [compost metagenome]